MQTVLITISAFVATRAQCSSFIYDATDKLAGDLSMLHAHSFINVAVHNNPKLCGMVPNGVRWAHGEWEIAHVPCDPGNKQLCEHA